MGMRILVVDLSVGGPAGMADAVGTGWRFLRHQFRESGNPARALAGFDMIAVDDGDAGRIVAAIFQTAQPLEQNGARFRAPDVTNDPEHIERLKLVSWCR